METFDRKTVIDVIITSTILLFYSFIIFGIYILALILVLIFRYKWTGYDLKKLKNVLANITVGAVTIFSLTILFEIWLQLYPHRFIGIDKINIMGEFSDYTSRGYLTEDVLKKKKDIVRILGLGDSFSVYLRDKKQNYNDILQQKYIDSGKGEVEVINAGMEGMGPGYYWHILNKFGKLINPDLVLVGFFVGNDFEEAEISVFIGNIIMEPKNLIKRYSKYGEFSYWRLCKLLKNKYTHYREARRKKQEAKQQPAQEEGTFSQATFIEVEKKRSWIFNNNKRDDLQQRWQECSNILLKIKDWCDRKQIKMVIAILPEQFQVDQALREEVLIKYKHNTEENLDLSYPNTLIVNFCRTHDINCLDMLAQFQAQGETRPLYKLRDSHWNEAGNRLAADLIFAYLEKNNLLPSRPGH